MLLSERRKSAYFTSEVKSPILFPLNIATLLQFVPFAPNSLLPSPHFASEVKSPILQIIATLLPCLVCITTMPAFLSILCILVHGIVNECFAVCQPVACGPGFRRACSLILVLVLVVFWSSRLSF